MAREGLHGGLEMLNGKTMKVKPRFHWRLHDTGNVGVMGYLPRNATHRERSEPWREKWVVVSKSRRVRSDTIWSLPDGF